MTPHLVRQHLSFVSGRLEELVIPYLYGTAVTDRARPPLGGAGLFSTATDLAKFYQMMLNRGSANGRQILRPATRTDAPATP